MAALIEKYGKITTQLVFLWLLAGLIHYASSHLDQISCLEFFLLDLAIALPIYLYISEYHLFRHRAVIDAAWHEDSFVRRWFWKGGLVKMIAFIIALATSFVLIQTASLLDSPHWWIVYIDVPVILLLSHFITKAMAGQVKEEYWGMISRRVLNGANIALLAMVFLLADLFFVAVPDTTHLELEQVFKSQIAGAQEAPCWLCAYPHALVKGVDATTWHLMQVGVPKLDGVMSKVVAWLIFLIPAAVSAALLHLLFIGGLVMIEIKERKGWKVLGDTLFSKSLMGTLIVIAVVYFYAVTIMSNTDFSKPHQVENQTKDQETACTKEKDSVVETVLKEVHHQIDRRAETIQGSTNEAIDREMAAVYKLAEQGVDQYLDWFFSVVGEYERLLLVFTGDVHTQLVEKLNEKIFRETGLSDKLDSIQQVATSHADQQMMALADEVQATKALKTSAHPCELGHVKITDAVAIRDELKAGTAMATGVVSARIAGQVTGKKLAAMTAAKIGKKAGFQSAVKLIGKVVGKKAASTVAGSVTTGALTGLVCGPGAAVCMIAGGIVGGVATWLAVDAAFMEIDELIHHDDLRREMMDVVSAQLKEHENELKLLMAAKIAVMSTKIKDVSSQEFIPARDGM